MRNIRFLAFIVLAEACPAILLAEEPQLRPIADCSSSRPIDGDNMDVPGRRIVFAVDDSASYASMPGRQTGFAFVYPWPIAEENPSYSIHNLNFNPAEDGGLNGTISLVPAAANLGYADWGLYPGIFHIPPGEDVFMLEIREPRDWPWGDRLWDILECRRLS